MRILYLSSWFPYPPNNGARLRVLDQIRYLAKRHEITLLCFAQDELTEQDLAPVRCYCRQVLTVPGSLFQPSHWRALVGYFSPKPRALIDTYSTAMQVLVQRTLDEDQFDVVVASEIGVGIVTTPYVRGARGVPRILEDLELSMISDRVTAEPGLVQRLRAGLTWWKLRRYVPGLLRDLDGCTVASEKEREVLLNVVPGYKPIALVPNGVDLDSYVGNWGPPEPDSLVFPGALTYGANLDAMQFFLEEILPRIRARRPGVVLRITGRTNGVPSERLVLGEGVILTGYLDDVRPTIAQSWVCVVPLRLGGGTRLKILEAMALGTPVVATRKGAEGLDVVHGEHLFVADDPSAYAACVVELLERAELRAQLARQARDLVAAKYNWSRIGTELERFLYEVAGCDRKLGEEPGQQAGGSGKGNGAADGGSQ